MGLLVVFSLFVKSLGAILEIGAQAMISQLWSVETYGTYSFFVSVAEGMYALLFAGMVKLNNLYISQKCDLTKFKKRYYFCYVLPLIFIGILLACYTKNTIWLLACIAALSYLLAMDSSSTLMSYGKYGVALIGEYSIGRILLLFLILIFSFIKTLDVTALYVAYAVLFLALFLFCMPTLRAAKKKSVWDSTVTVKNAIKKYVVFQSAEISNTIIMQSSVIVQYIFGGAYQTALVSIVLIVRRLINFISGPTSKLYQPEFARKYAAGDRDGLAAIYAQITRIQLCFITPAFSLLIAAPEILLSIFNKDLVGHTDLVQYTAFVFLYMIAFGPQANLLAMTGKERSSTVINWLSVFVMYLFMYIFKENTYFVVIGFCAQIIFCTTFSLFVQVRHMKRFPMPFWDYLKLGTITAVTAILIHSLSRNLVVCLLIVALHFIANFIFVFPKNEREEMIEKFFSKWRKI